MNEIMPLTENLPKKLPILIMGSVKEFPITDTKYHILKKLHFLNNKYKKVSLTDIYRKEQSYMNIKYTSATVRCNIKKLEKYSLVFTIKKKNLLLCKITEKGEKTLKLCQDVINEYVKEAEL